MKRKAYLTIDDSPSERTDDLLDALTARGVPAILFCRGDLLDQNPQPIIHAIQKGFVIGNHGYLHKRASQLGFEAACENIRRADALIEDVYKKAGVTRPRKYYRFAYMDRGMGPWFVEPASVPPRDYDYVAAMVEKGLGNDASLLPTPGQIANKNGLQAYLAELGYTPVPFKNVTHDFYAHSEMATAVDVMFTYSTSDWVMTARHRDRAFDLAAAMDADPHLARTDTAHVILMHDQAEIHDGVIGLVDHMLDKGFEFERINA